MEFHPRKTIFCPLIYLFRLCLDTFDFKRLLVSFIYITAFVCKGFWTHPPNLVYGHATTRFSHLALTKVLTDWVALVSIPFEYVDWLTYFFLLRDKRLRLCLAKHVCAKTCEYVTRRKSFYLTTTPPYPSPPQSEEKNDYECSTMIFF